MGYFDDECPSNREEARRRGERDYEAGRPSYRNPYEHGQYGDYDCRRAYEAWDDGYRYARRRDEQRQDEERQHAEEAERRAQWAREAEADYYARMEEASLYEEHEAESEPPDEPMLEEPRP
jgi:hypothetical protein